MKYKTKVKYNGKYYDAGTEVPDDVAPDDVVPDDAGTEASDERKAQPEKKGKAKADAE